MLFEGKNKSWNKKFISEVMSVTSPITNEYEILRHWAVLWILKGVNCFEECEWNLIRHSTVSNVEGPSGSMS